MSRIIAIVGCAALAIAALHFNTQQAKAGGEDNPCSGVDCGDCPSGKYCDDDEDCGCKKLIES